jgi:hypothetical protein
MEKIHWNDLELFAGTRNGKSVISVYSGNGTQNSDFLLVFRYQFSVIFCAFFRIAELGVSENFKFQNRPTFQEKWARSFFRSSFLKVELPKN